MHPILNIAIRAARAAGDSIVRQMDRVGDISIESKGKNDFVTEVDKNAEEIIIYTIKNTYPKHAFLGEETGQQGEGDFLWIIDPLDGTTNFLHGLPHFAVSIALQYKGVLDQAVVYDPLRQELFTASKGKGAFLGEKKISVQNKKPLYMIIGINTSGSAICIGTSASTAAANPLGMIKEINFAER